MKRIIFFQTITLLLFGSALVRANSDTLLPIQKNGKWGFINQNGKIIIPCEYEAALDWGTRKWGKVKLSGNWININRNGEQVSVQSNGTPKIFNDSVIIVSTPSGEYICDDLGNKILPEPFNNINKIGGNFFTYQMDDSIGLASITKGKLTAAKYDVITKLLDDSLFKIKICGYEGLIDMEGKELIPAIYNQIKLTSNSRVLVKDGFAELEGIFDLKRQKLIIEPLWGKIGDYNSWFTILQNENHIKVYFTNLEKIDSTRFEMASISNDLLFGVSNSFEGVMNENAEIIVPFVCSELLLEHNNLVAKKQDGYHLIDLKGNNKIKGPYLDYNSIETPNYLFKNNDEKWTLFDSLGNVIYKNLINPTIQKNIIKSKHDGQMTRIELNKHGKIQEQNSFNNVVTLKVNRFVDNSRLKKRDPSIQTNFKSPSKRWFLDEEKRLYGLKSSDGKILIKPQFNDIDLGKSDLYTIVYHDTEDELITYGENQFIIKLKAGLVHNETGKILIPAQYAGIRITGDEKDPLIFAITKNFRFVHYLPNEDKMGDTYLWVDQTKETPVRVLKKAAMTKTEKNNETPQQFFNYTMLGFSPMHIIPQQAKYYTNNTYYQSVDPKWTYISKTNESLDEFAYAERFDNYDAARVIVKSNNKWGLINKKLNFVIPPEFTSIKLSENDHYLLSKSDSIQGIVYDNSRQTILENAHKIISFNNERAYYRGTNGAGYWSKEQGDILSKGTEDIRESSSSLIPIKRLNKWGFINEKGDIIIECKYTKVNPFKDGFATVKIKGKWKLIDDQGNELKELPWKNIKCMGNLLIVSNGNHWKVSSIGDSPDLDYPAFYGFRKIHRSSYFWCKGVKQNFIVNSDGTFMVNTKYDNVHFLGDSAFLISGKKRHYLQIGNKIVKTVPKKMDILWVKGNLMGIQKSGKMYLADTNFQLVSTKAYRNIKPSPEGKMIASDKRQNYVLSFKGEVELSSKLRIKENTKKNFNIAINERMQFVFIDSIGQQVFNRIFQRIVSDGNSNYWAQNSNQLWGLLDSNLEWIIEPKFKQIQVISKGITKTLNENIIGYCDLNGKFIVPAKYPSIENLNGYFKAQIGDEVHWYNPNGNCIYGPEKNPIAEKSKP